MSSEALLEMEITKMKTATQQPRAESIGSRVGGDNERQQKRREGRADGSTVKRMLALPAQSPCCGLGCHMAYRQAGWYMPTISEHGG